MLDVALKVLNEIDSHGFKAYIVGGFVRDYILGNITNDVDICTEATPKDIKEIFDNITLPRMDYGAVRLDVKKYRFDIMTFRKEISYYNNRKPMEVEYIKDLLEDLKRRDFTMNTLCMDKDGNILDLLDGQKDIDNRVIVTVGDPITKFMEDPLRILRAIRFYTTLNFSLSEEVESAIKRTKSELSRLSYQRKKEELDKIFSSSNAKKGIRLLLDLGLDRDLELIRLNKIKNTNSLIGIWSVLDVCDKYPFNSNEKELIKNVNRVIKLNNLDMDTLYKYGLYVNSVAGEIKGIDIKDITKEYNDLVIKSRNEIAITSDEIMEILDREPGSYLKDVYDDLEKMIIYGKLDNDETSIRKYLENKYKEVL